MAEKKKSSRAAKVASSAEKKASAETKKNSAASKKAASVRNTPAVKTEYEKSVIPTDVIMALSSLAIAVLFIIIAVNPDGVLLQLTCEFFGDINACPAHQCGQVGYTQSGVVVAADDKDLDVVCSQLGEEIIEQCHSFRRGSGLLVYIPCDDDGICLLGNGSLYCLVQSIFLVVQ